MLWLLPWLALSGATEPNLEVIPHNKDGSPLHVFVDLYVESVRDLGEDITIVFYMQEKWHWPELARLIPENASDAKFVASEVKHYWRPDSYFYLVRGMQVDSQAQFIEVHRKDAVVKFNKKVLIVAPCLPGVSMFPFDTIECKVTISSYSYTILEMKYRWGHDGIMLEEAAGENIDESGFYLESINIFNQTANYSTDHQYDIAHSLIRLNRSFLVYILDTYIPSALIVSLSWITFWVDRASTPARGAISITTVLTMITMTSNSIDKFSKYVQSNVSAIDIYLWVCFGYVILSVVLFAISDYSRLECKPEKRRFRKRLHDFPARGLHVNNAALRNPPVGAPSFNPSNSLNINSSLRSEFDGYASIETRTPRYQPSKVPYPLTTGSLPRTRHHSDIEDDMAGCSATEIFPLDQMRGSIRRIDNTARWALPATFAVFNLFYWFVIVYQRS